MAPHQLTMFWGCFGVDSHRGLSEHARQQAYQQHRGCSSTWNSAGGSQNRNHYISQVTTEGQVEKRKGARGKEKGRIQQKGWGGGRLKSSSSWVTREKQGHIVFGRSTADDGLGAWLSACLKKKKKKKSLQAACTVYIIQASITQCSINTIET